MVKKENKGKERVGKEGDETGGGVWPRFQRLEPPLRRRQTRTALVVELVEIRRTDTTLTTTFGRGRATHRRLMTETSQRNLDHCNSCSNNNSLAIQSVSN